MRRHLCFVSALWLVGVLAAPAVADDQAEAQAIIYKAIKAMGGADHAAMPPAIGRRNCLQLWMSVTNSQRVPIHSRGGYCRFPVRSPR